MKFAKHFTLEVRPFKRSTFPLVTGYSGGDVFICSCVKVDVAIQANCL